jgi:hypothetical protein
MVNPLTGPPVTVPVLVSNSWPSGAINSPQQVTCGYQFGAPLTTNGTVWGWGNNSKGELGDGTTLNRSSPVQVMNVSNIVVVSGGDSHSSALATDGTVWKWGLNNVGELGNGTTNAVANAVPTRILVDVFGHSFSNIVMVSARDYHNIALKADGSVWMWGANDQGQCGNGTTNGVWRPSPVVGLGPRTGLRLNLGSDPQPGYADLTWSSAPGEYFAVEFSTNLAHGFTTVLQSNILATPPTNLVTVPMSNTQAYYRLKF